MTGLDEPPPDEPLFDPRDMTIAPPHDEEAEMATLGSMLAAPHVINDVEAILGPSGKVFYRPAHETIYEAVLALHGKPHTRPDVITVTAALRTAGDLERVGGATYLHTLLGSTPSPASAGWYAHIVRTHSRLRTLVEIGTRLVHRARSVQAEPDEIVDAVLGELQGLLAQEAGGGEEDISVAARWEPFVDELAAGVDPDALDSPWRDLNEVAMFKPRELTVVGAATGGGKALALDTPLPTPSGWTTMGAVEVGDLLLGADGRPCRVTAATEVMHDRPCFEIEFSDGTVIVADAEHQWLTHTAASLQSRQRAAARTNGQRNQRTFPAVRTTAEIAATVRLRTADRRVNHSIANAHALVLPAADLLVAPYTLGAWLGDGDSLTAAITTADPEILERIRLDGYEIRARKHPLHFGISNETEWRARVAEGVSLARDGMPIKRAAAHVKVAHETIQKVTGPNLTGWKRSYVCVTTPLEKYRTLQELLRAIGVLGDKHIPASYLRASEEQRRELLAGLLDTDGTVNRQGGVQFAVTSRRLAEDTFELIASLGYRPAMRTKPVKGRRPESSTCYIVSFTTPDKVVYLTRKAQRLVTVNREGVDRRYIVGVRPSASVPVRCVQVDNADHLYLASHALIPTHNSLLGLNMAAHVALRRGRPVLVASMEMNWKELLARITAAESGVQVDHLVRRKLTEEDWKLVAKVSDLMAGARNLHLDDSPGLTVAKIRARARWLASKGMAPGLVVVDYMQLITPDDARSNVSRTQEVAKISRGLKLIADEFSVPVIALAQFNRSSVGRQPLATDFKDSSQIEQDASLVLLLHRELAADGTDTGPTAGQVQLIVGKNRNGVQGCVIDLNFQGRFGRLRSAAPPAWTPHGAAGGDQ